MEGRPQILTIGHSTHPIERFVALLESHAVEALADVRRFPGSRRNPQFNGEALAASLAGAGIEYVPLGEKLGGRRELSPGAPDRGWRNASFAGYAEHMQGDDFAAGLALLEGLARSRPTAYMCAEADWRRCHRRLISDALVARGWLVLHLGARGDVEEHPHALFGRADD